MLFSRRLKKLTSPTPARRTAMFHPRLEGLEGRAVPAVITVTSLGDGVGVDGQVTLREAILSINSGANVNADIGNPGAYGSSDLIFFDLPGSGLQTIQVFSPLPAINKPVGIDGHSQTGATYNTLSKGDNAVIKIVLDGFFAGPNTDGLTINGNDVSVIGLNIQRFNGSGIVLNGVDCHVLGCFIGTNAGGTSLAGNGKQGIVVTNADNVIGSSTPLGRNIISGNLTGVLIQSAGNIVQGNYIGTDTSGTVKLGNTQSGVQVYNLGNTIGGATAGAANVISGNGGSGIVLFDADNTVQGNFIGLNPSGGNCGNGYFGILIDGNSFENHILNNTIAYNGSVGGANQGAGVGGNAAGTKSVGNNVLGNLIYANAGQPIDWGLDGVTANDPGDVDIGTNGKINFPMLTVANIDKNSTTVVGTYSGAPNLFFTVEFFHNPTPNGVPVFLGSANAVTDAAGNGVVYFATSQLVSGGAITATATSAGNTSEYAAPVNVTAAPYNTALEKFVYHAYLDVLHRPSDVLSQIGWTNYLNSGKSPAQFASLLVNSPEGRKVTITDMYARFLRRAPDPAGLSFFSSFLTQGGTVEQARSALIGSAEYYVLAGGTTAAFLDRAYSDLLNRAPDAAGQSYFSTQIGSGVSRTAVAAVLGGSSEASRVTVDRLFKQYLHRPADSGAKTFFGDLLTNKQIRDEQLIAALVGSAEYLGSL